MLRRVLLSFGLVVLLVVLGTSTVAIEWSGWEVLLSLQWQDSDGDMGADLVTHRVFLRLPVIAFAAMVLVTTAVLTMLSYVLIRTRTNPSDPDTK